MMPSEWLLRRRHRQRHAASGRARWNLRVGVCIFAIVPFSLCFTAHCPGFSSLPRLVDGSRVRSVPRGCGSTAAAVADASCCMTNNRLLHAMLKVSDINASIAFCRELGMSTLSYAERPNGAGTAFVGFGQYADTEHFALELSAAARPKAGAERKTINVGDGLQFLGIAGLGQTETATSPDGYRVRRYCGKSDEKDLSELCLRVSDLSASSRFYSAYLGMNEVSDPSCSDLDGYACRALRFKGGSHMVLRLVEMGSDTFSIGDGFDHMVMSTQDVHKAAEALKTQAVEITLPPTVMFGLNITGIKDPDGYAIYLVDEEAFLRQRKLKS